MEVDHSDEEEDFDLNKGVKFVKINTFLIFVTVIYSLVIHRTSPNRSRPTTGSF